MMVVGWWRTNVDDGNFRCHFCELSGRMGLTLGVVKIDIK